MPLKIWMHYVVLREHVHGVGPIMIMSVAIFSIIEGSAEQS